MPGEVVAALVSAWVAESLSVPAALVDDLGLGDGEHASLSRVPAAHRPGELADALFLAEMIR